MKFIEITKEEFEKVSNNYEISSFYQTTNWAKIKEQNDWISYYVGIKEKNEIIACSLILGKKININQYLYYSPRGPLINYNDKKILSFFFNNIRIFLKERKGIIFKIDPLIIYQNHDKNGNVINNNFSNNIIVENLKELGLKHNGFTKGYTDEAQFRWSYCLNINKSEANIFEEMDQRCRRCIRKYKKYPLELKDVDDTNIKEFKEIMEHTANRQNHFDRNIEYYKSLKENLKERCKIVIIYLDKKEYLENNKEDKLYEMIKEESKEKIPISAGVFIFDKQRANYVYGGTYKKYMPLMAQYKLQMEMIKYAKELKIPLYDFGGISGDFNPNSKNYGVYEFKRGFGGYVVEYIGEFDLILDKLGYNIYDKSYDLYREIKKIIAKIIKY